MSPQALRKFEGITDQMATDLFVGVKINANLQQSLDAASLPFRRYFEGGKFLTIIEREDGNWLGKQIAATSSADRLDDMRRHVRSVILKIDPDNHVPLYGIEVVEMPPEPEEEAE